MASRYSQGGDMVRQLETQRQVSSDRVRGAERKVPLFERGIEGDFR